ncbi:MAG: hypothetical protein WA667_06765, partial [Candidatus Nitrosopolaris sp.]
PSNIFVRYPSPSPSGYPHILKVAASSYNIKNASATIRKTNEEHAIQITEEDVSIEQEIECPRCCDVMTLHSEFHRLGYFCEECSFSLHLSH